VGFRKWIGAIIFFLCTLVFVVDEIRQWQLFFLPASPWFAFAMVRVRHYSCPPWFMSSRTILIFNNQSIDNQ
jgi:hypothetical protein